MIILNELDYAEQCIKENIIDEKPYSTLSILAKYYYHHLGFRKKQIIKELTDFLSKNYPKYTLDKIYCDSLIEKLANNAGKFKLHEIEGVWITKAEFETIEALHNKVLERLAFTMLCLAKLAIRKNPKANGWINDDVKDIFSLARISGSVVDRYMRIADLYNANLIELPKRNDQLSYRVAFIDDESENELFVHDFRELGYEYLKYTGQNIIRCAECGILVRGNKAGTKRYCSACAAYTPQETKSIICIDCGKEIKVSSKNNQTSRCSDCQKFIDREKTRLRKQKQREKERMSR